MSEPFSPLKPGAAIGILGGGQLGRMLAMAAAKLGHTVQIYCPGTDNPAFNVAEKSYANDYDDKAALAEFANACDIITFEFENVPAATVEFLSPKTPVFPDIRALSVAQDRLIEREFLNASNIPVAPYAAISTAQEALDAVAKIGTPSVLKTRRLGYDGKGQAVIKNADEILKTWEDLGKVPAILEAFIPFDKEISVIIARTHSGEMVAFDPGENIHLNHILDTTTIPADIPDDVQENALKTAKNIANSLNYVGILAVEMFVCSDGDHEALYVNELAPRVHNSGHWTQDACAIDQFEQHIRAITGWPLGNGERHFDAVMKNLIGDDVLQWRDHATRPNHCLHLYGKSEVRKGRKMGHVNIISPKKADNSI